MKKHQSLNSFQHNAKRWICNISFSIFTQILRPVPGAGFAIETLLTPALWHSKAAVVYAVAQSLLGVTLEFRFLTQFGMQVCMARHYVSCLDATVFSRRPMPSINADAIVHLDWSYTQVFQSHYISCSVTFG